MQRPSKSLGDRIKKFYEDVYKTYLTRRTPVIIRLDGRAFHTFTKGTEKPFDDIISTSMVETMEYLCKKVPNCIIGYTQSDEITLVLVDYRTLDDCAWFDYSVQKLCSITASMCTLAFNKLFEKNVRLYASDKSKYTKQLEVGATFDSRCFNIPKEEVTNAILFRQMDAIRNSTHAFARSFFKTSELKGKNGEEQKKMVFDVYGKNYDDVLPKFKKGVFAVKGENGKWTLDFDAPILKGEGRKYIESKIKFEEE